MISGKSLLILGLALTQFQISNGQSISTLMSARAAGVGNASSTLTDEWSMFNNIGGLAKTDCLNAAFAFEARPRLPGSNRMAAAFATPMKLGAAGFSLFRFGDDLYSEQLISAGYSNQFGIASLGLKVSYVQYRAEGVGTRSFVGVDFGGITQLTPQIAIGAYIVNLTQPRLASVDNEKAPTRLIAGLSFKPTDECLILSEIEKELDYDPTIKGGVEYTIHKKVNVRTGFNLKPGAAFFGLGFKARKVKIDYALQYNQTLSTVHQASAVYSMDQKKKEE